MKHPLRHSSPLSMSALSPTFRPSLLFLLALPFLSRARAQPSDAIPLSPSGEAFSENVTLRHATSRKFNVILPLSSSLLAEFVDTSPLSAFVREGRPHILLTAVVSPAPNPNLITTSGRASEAGAVSRDDYDCSQDFPCLRKGDGIDVDDEAFFTHARRAAVRFHTLPEDAIVVVELHNFDRNHTAIRDDDRELKPQLKGTIRISAFKDGDQPQCAGYVSSPDDGDGVCLRHGTCEKDGSCKCDSGFGDPMCATPVLDSAKPPEVPSEKDWVAEPLKNGVVVSVPAFSRAVFSWTQTDADSQVHVRALVLSSGVAPSGTEFARRSNTSVGMFIKAPFENGNKYLNLSGSGMGPQLPSVYDTERECIPVWVRSAEVWIFHCYRGEKIKKNTNLLIAINADATGSDEKEPGPAVISFLVFRCNTGGVACPQLSDRDVSPISIPIAVLPVCVATIGITALAIGVMLWLDRRHGFTSSVDKLSQKELDRMYPTEKFRVRPGERREGPAGQETDECLICLSKLEQNEVVRRLNCEHIYHSECLDPWLTQNNASCPACRSDVRIQSLSDRRRLRRLVTFCLWPVVWYRRLRARRSGDNVGYEREAAGALPLDVESGLRPPVAAGPNTSAEPVQHQAVGGAELSEVSSAEPAQQEGDDDIRRGPESR